MNRETPAALQRAGDAGLACVLLAIDPSGLGGAVLRGPGGPAQDGWIATFRQLSDVRRIMRVPPHVGADRLLGGIDVAATLKRGKPHHEKGLLAEADGATLLLPSAERLAADKAAFIAAAMDQGEVSGPGGTHPSRFSLIVLDEGQDTEEAAPRVLSERAAFLIDMTGLQPVEVTDADLAAARLNLPLVRLTDDVAQALCSTALAFGIASVRPAIQAARAARVLAAFDNRTTVDIEDAAIAARLVLAPRATRLPQAPEEPEQPTAEQQPEQQRQDESDAEQDSSRTEQDLSEILLQAVKVALPPGLLAELERNLRTGLLPKSGAGAISQQTGLKRGRPAGTRRGDPRHGAA